MRMVPRATAERQTRTGTRNGMEYVAWGEGARTLLFIQGGPGSDVPKSALGRRLTRMMFKPYLTAGYSVLSSTRRRHMPDGYTVADMADDYARLVTEELGGKADLVVGESYGGMIAQYLAALHPDRIGQLALVATGSRLSQWSDEVDTRLIAALERGDARDAAVVFGEYLLPAPWARMLRRALAPLLARRMHPLDDVLVETRADLTYDARPVLPRIRARTLLVCGDRDAFFPRGIIEETASLIPECRVVWKEGKGHVGTIASGHVAADVLAFVRPSPPT